MVSGLVSAALPTAWREWREETNLPSGPLACIWGSASELGVVEFGVLVCVDSMLVWCSVELGCAELRASHGTCARSRVRLLCL